MGEFTNFNNSPEASIMKDKQVDVPDEKIDVPGFKDIKCDGIYQVDSAPIFKVSHNEFYQNTSNGRQRLRFKSGSDVQKFMQNGRYKKPFYLRHEKSGYIRKIK